MLADPCVAIIDDDESFCRSVRRWMNAADFTAATYRSAEEFLADHGHWHFSCLLVDIQLGGMSGLEMHRRLVAEGCRTPVIFMTAYDDPAALADVERRGCCFLRKTDAGVRLMEAIRRACEPVAKTEQPSL